MRREGIRTVARIQCGPTTRSAITNLLSIKLGRRGRHASVRARRAVDGEIRGPVGLLGDQRALKTERLSSWKKGIFLSAHNSPPSAESFMDGAMRFRDAACILIKGSTAVDPIGLLASHSLELGLKAYLLHTGVSVDEVRS